MKNNIEIKPQYSRSALSDTQDAALHLWGKEFGEIPWIDNELTISPLTGISSSHFQIIFDGIDEVPKISLLGESLESPSRTEVAINITDAPDNFGYLVSTAVDRGIKIVEIKISQSGETRNCHVVCLQYDDKKKEWIVIYNSIDRTKELTQRLARLYEASGFREVTPLLTKLFGRRRREADGLIYFSPFLNQNIGELALILKKFQLQFSKGHGLKRPFKFWGEKEINSYFSSINFAVKVLSDLTPAVCLVGGAVLGWQRNQSMLMHDDDVDLMIAFDSKSCGTIAEGMEIVSGALVKSEFRVKERFFNHLWVESDSDDKTFDVFIGIIEDDRLSCYTTPRKALDVAKIFPASLVNFHGYAMPIPRDTIHYLEVNYGPNWTVPDPNWKQLWDIRPYADIAGKRDRRPLLTRGEYEFRNELLNGVKGSSLKVAF